MESARPLPSRGLRDANRERLAMIALAIAMVLAAILILSLSRSNTFFADELTIFQRLGGGFDLEALLRPHNGHLIAIANLIYQGTFELSGPDYSLLRVLGVLGVLACSLLTFVYVRRRLGAAIALAPAVVLLFLGASWETLLWPLSVFTTGLAIAAGLGALLVLERRDRLGDAAACGLLLVAILAHSTGLAFLIGVAVAILLREDRWQRVWVFAIPLLAYAAWWLWALQFDEGQAEAQNALLIPSFVAEALAAVTAAITGLSIDLTAAAGDEIAFVPSWGRPLALVAGVALVIRLVRGRVPPSLWVSLAIVLCYWAFLALAIDEGRSAAASRYLFPGAVLFFLVAADALKGIRLPRPAVIAVFVVAVASIATNIRQLDAGESLFRDFAPLARADLAMLELASAEVSPEFAPAAAPELEGAVPEHFLVEAGPYLVAAQRFGSFAFSLEEVFAQGPDVRDAADRVLASASGVGMAAAENPEATGSCERIEAAAEGEAPPQHELAPGAYSLRSASPAELSLGRFSDGAPVSLGALERGEPVELALPAGAGGEQIPWHLSAAGAAAVEVCALG
jgi:hypothetical protein